MAQDFDVCVIGSGAGGGPVAWALSQAGYSVLVLEKGPWFREADFAKDELACCRRSHYTPNLRDEQHVLEDADGQGGWDAVPTGESGRDFWNGSLVGGSSNLMSGFFHRMKPKDFRLLSEYGPIAGANLA
ncbi:MAG: NAD(P)-binding protein, partial [Gammaproteobacteria bacterium SHHR-1]